MTPQCGTCGCSIEAPPFTQESFLFAYQWRRREVLNLRNSYASPKTEVGYYRKWQIHRYIFDKRVYSAFKSGGEEAARAVYATWQSPAVQEAV